MEYDLYGGENFSAEWPGTGCEINRFAEDWPTQHLFQTLYMLCEQKQSTFAFLKNGGMAFASRVRSLTAETLAAAARIAPRGGIRELMQNKDVPQIVRDALHAMQLSQADVIGTDGHRRLCRREGWAYMEAFGAPLIFTTPNLADTKQILLLEVQGYKVEFDASHDFADDLPKYRDMMCRLARDPVGQTVVFELLMRLFFLHVLGVRPECLHNRRKVARRHTREWCTDGVAASSTFFGVFGPVLAFRGEVEAQGRGSLHPHILVWLVASSLHTVVSLPQRDTDTLQSRLRVWMRAVVSSVEAIHQSSVAALPRRFGNTGTSANLKPHFTMAQQQLIRFDGQSELHELRSKGDKLTANQTAFWSRAEMKIG